MKVKAIARTESGCTRESTTALYQVHRNLDPHLHPLAKPREMARAIKAAKLDRMMAKPFVYALAGHRDGVYAMCKHPTLVNRVVSGSADGELRVWCLSTQSTVYQRQQAHQGMIKGVVAVPSTLSSSSSFLSSGSPAWVLSCGLDARVHAFSLTSSSTSPLASPEHTWTSSYGFTCMDHHPVLPQFVTGNAQGIQVWQHTFHLPTTTLPGAGDASYTSVKHNPTEPHVVASTASDRCITLYDTRMGSDVRKVVLGMSSNDLSWNPLFPSHFVVANEDHNAYVFDTRYLTHPTMVYKDHVSAVLSVDFSPLGTHFVTGGYDCTLRVFATAHGHASDVYHTQRMQRVWRVLVAVDTHYLVSGSDDGGVRVWKAAASAPTGILAASQRAQLDLAALALHKYAHVPSVRHIAGHRLVPKAVRNAEKVKRKMVVARKEKEQRAWVFAKQAGGTTGVGANGSVGERGRVVVAVEK